MTAARGILWQTSCAEHAAAPPLDADATADVVVIGGGFTGSAAALEAAGSGASVVLLEAEEIGFGGSGRNVGLVNAGLWVPPDGLIEIMGEEAGTRLIEALGAAPDAVFDLIARHGIDCEPVRNGTLHCAHAPSGFKDLQDRFRQGNRHGAPLQLLDAEEATRRTGATGVHGALFDPRAGTVQPRAYAVGLARAAAEQGARIHAGSAVSAIRHDGDVWEVVANGHRVRAGALLLATNAYHAGITGPFAPEMVPVHFSQFATAPIPEELRDRILPGGEGCWDTALVMNSFRLDAAGRMIFGGIGDLDGPAGAIHDGWARRKLRTLFPELGDLPIEHAWQGRIAMTKDHVPKVVEFGPRALAPFGYSGRGIGPGTVFGRACARALLSGDMAGIPVAPVDHYIEHHKGLRAAWYEFGAAVTHAMTPPPFARQG